MPTYDDLIAQLSTSVNQTKVVTDEAILLIEGFPARVQAAVEAAVAAGATPEQTQAFNDLLSTLDTDIAELKAARDAAAGTEPPVEP